MATRMLIDATHPEETRVVVVKGTRLEEFDFETSTKKQLKGNIYLAKVTRVEPSLQAAFVEYGGNRHGFLAFSEIHPDYYQIPVADREALLQQERADEKAALEEEDAEAATAGAEAEGGNGEDEKPAKGGRGRRRRRRPTAEESGEQEGDEEGNCVEPVENVGGDEIDEVGETRQKRRPRIYKIQEVIKRRQILLIQVVKEERGNKGAALTTYLSLAGRYCVLMPNTARGGGISRKIVNAADRKSLKAIAASLDVPEGMGVIVRTAGANRTKAEIKRDFEYLLRLWDDIRELTLKSIAPALVYEEANLIKRSIRDLYSKDIDEILVEGEDGYRIAKDFMRMLMPSHAKKVQPYRDRIPLFHRFQVEQQFDSMYSPEVTLKSGGYIIINSTEALVAIDVNSGKSTKEHNIEDTAYKTNLEAAEEVARQLKLRDLAGLIVIDFIDMEENRNNRNVERRLKECLKSDRARIQVGKISAFGLLEMSRQRLRPGLLEASTTACPHCAGTGLIRSTESTALHILRSLEEEGVRERSKEISVQAPTEVAIYLLNNKRDALLEIEQRYDFQVFIGADDSLITPDYRLERTKAKSPEEISQAVQPEGGPQIPEALPEEGEAEEEGGKSKRRRRRRRKPRGEEAAEEAVSEEAEAAEEAAEAPEAIEAEGEAPEAETEEEERARKRRRRGKRGGRRRRKTDEETAAEGEGEAEVAAEGEAESAVAEAVEVLAVPAEEAAGEEAEKEPPKPKRRTRRPSRKTEVVAEEAAEAAEIAEMPAPEGAPAEEAAAEAELAVAEVVAAIEPEAEEAEALAPLEAAAPEAVEEEQPKRKQRLGWWRRRS